MAFERPNISVKNNVVIVEVPDLSNVPSTFLTTSVSTGGTSLTVKSNDGFSQNVYVILGEIGQKQTEIVKINAAVSAGTSLTIVASTFAHPAGTKVQFIRYNQAAIYGSTTASDASPTIIGSAENIDVENGKNIIEISSANEKSYYYARFYNSTSAVYSAYSDSVISTGLSFKARGHIKSEFLSMFNERVDDLISDDWLNRSINRWQYELQKRKNDWSTLRDSTISNTTQDVQKYALPSDITDNESADSIISLKYYNEPALKYVPKDVYDGLTSDWVGTTLSANIGLADVTVSLTDASDFASSGTINIQGDSISYTGKSGNTLTGVTAITATHASGDEVWQTYSTGTPSKFTVDNGYFKLYPLPGSSEASKNLYLEYWQNFAELVDDADETLFNYPTNCYLYLHYQAAIRRRLPEDVKLLRKNEWMSDLEELVAEDSEVTPVRIQPRDFYKQSY